ncbi:DsrE family protein [Thiohalospira sp.]|uniref:DsrE family protein n=1 Tax=Thiohalospira sp. TaxID=3080549 RepID=UPI0039805E00
MSRIILSLLVALFAFGLAAPAAAVQPSAGLDGVEQAKAVYQFNTGKPKKAAAMLEGVGRNFDALAEAGHDPDFVVVFAGPAVRLLTEEPPEKVADRHGDRLLAIEGTVEELAEAGVRMEICATALDAFDIDPDTVLDEIQPVPSGHQAIIGWQNRGYALVPVL